VYEHLPLYLQPSDYDTIAKRISEQGIHEQTNKNLEIVTGGSGSFFKEWAVKDPLVLTFLALPHLRNIAVDEQFVFQDGYLFTKDEKHLVLFIQPKLSGSETKENEQFVALLNDLKTAIDQKFQNVEVGYFGSSFIAVANAQQIKKDILTTISLSMSALMLILMLYYRKVLIPILVFIPSIFGGLTALALMYFITENLSAISISVSAILLGITIDYSLHYLTHSKAITNTQSVFKEITRPLFMSSFTTAIAFLCLLFVDAKALNDLGWFAFIAVIASGFFTLLILPHIYKPKNKLETAHFIDKIATYPFEKNKIFIVVSLLLVIGSLFTYHKVTFDQDLSKINYFPKDQKENQQLIENTADQTKSLYVVSYGKDVNEVLRRADLVRNKAANDQEVLGINSITSVVLDEQTQQERWKVWDDFWKQHNLLEIENRLIRASSQAGFVEDTYKSFAQQLQRTYKPIGLDAYKAVNPQLVDEFISEKDGVYQVATIVKMPEAHRDTFIKNTETLAQTVVIDRQALNEELLGHLVTDFNNLVNISFVAVLVVLWFFFRRLELVLLATIPIGLTGLITAGIMGALNIPFNIFSSIVCTLIFGHGVDFTIFMTSALQKQYTYGKNEMPVYRTSIILAVLTTILAVGALIFAKHPALRSISSIALIGVSTAVLMTFVLYP
ncbi:MAG TPA: MMPL family transporter, partial [Flavobacterium sp.]|nr:MMPL family transporter [Flavobacterium sp.]